MWSPWLLAVAVALPGPGGSGTGPGLPDGIVFEAARMEAIADTLRLLAEVQPAPEGESVVASPVPAFVVSLAERGNLLVRGAAVARLRQALAPPPEATERARRAGEEATRLEDLARQGLVASARAEASRAEANRLAQAIADRADERALESPLTATVDDLFVRVGQLVEANQPIARLIDRRRLELRTTLPEAFAGLVRAGAEARVTLSATPDRSVEARLRSLAANADPATRTVAAAFAFTDPPHDSVRPGLAAVIAVAVAPSHEAVTVPRSALVARGGELLVVVRRGDDIEARAVTAGVRAADRVEILSGLEAGEIVVSRGAALLVAPALLPPSPSARAGAWLVVPRGRGLALAAALPPDGVAFASPPPRRVIIDARALLAQGLTLGRALEGLEKGKLPEGEGARFSPLPEALARRWTAGAAPEPVDVLAIERRDARALYDRARELDPAVELVGSPLDEGLKARLLLLGGLVVVLLGTGSLRAGAALLLVGAVLGELSGAPATRAEAAALALATVAAAVAVVSALEGARGGTSVARGRLALLALVVSVGGGATLIELTQPGEVPVALAVAGLLAAAAAATALTLLLGRLPSAASFLAAPLERLPPLALAGSLAAAGAGIYYFAPVPDGAAIIAVPGAAALDRSLVDAGLDRMAQAALAAGARSVVAAPVAEGAVDLVLTGPQIAHAAEHAIAAALPGLGVRLAAAGADTVMPGRPLVGTRVDPQEAALAEGLSAGAVRHRDLLLELADPGEAGLLPLTGAEGGMVLAREWSEPAVPRLFLTGAGPRFAQAPVAQALDFALVTALLTAAVVVSVVARERWRGASPRIALAGTHGFVARVSAAGPGAAAIAARGLPQTLTGALLLLAWAASLALALVAARLFYSRKSA